MPQIVGNEVRRQLGTLGRFRQLGAQDTDPLTGHRATDSPRMMEHPGRPLAVVGGEPEPGEVLRQRQAQPGREWDRPAPACLGPVVGAKTAEEKADFDRRMKKLKLPFPTETINLLFQNAAARWIAEQGTYEERMEKVETLAGLLKAPLEQFKTDLILARDGRRGETDYMVAMLHALMLAMPEWK